MPSQTVKALGKAHQAQRLRLSSRTDPVRQAFNQGLADALDQEALAALEPARPLVCGMGEVICAERPGLNDMLQNPSMTTLEASICRTTLAEAAGCLETALEAAQGVQSPMEKMLCHLIAAAHTRAMVLFAGAAKTSDPSTACLQAKAAARLMDSVSRAILVLTREKHCTHAVQHVAVNGNAVVGMLNR